MLGNGLEMPIALCRRGLSRLARHRTATWRHDHGRIRMACRHLAIDVVPVEGTIGREGGDGTVDLVELRTDLGAIIDLRSAEL